MFVVINTRPTVRTFTQGHTLFLDRSLIGAVHLFGYVTKRFLEGAREICKKGIESVTKGWRGHMENVAKEMFPSLGVIHLLRYAN